MALTTATVADQISADQPGPIGALRAKRVIITFTSGYDSATGVTLNAAACGLAQIVAVNPEGATNTGANIGVVVSAVTGNAVVKLWNGTTLVATSDQSATTAAVLVLGH